jgi:hypothetical protein
MAGKCRADPETIRVWTRLGTSPAKLHVALLLTENDDGAVKRSGGDHDLS